METTRVESNSVSLFSSLAGELDLQVFICIIPHLNIGVTARNDELLPHTDIHSIDRLVVEMLVDVLKSSLVFFGRSGSYLLGLPLFNCRVIKLDIYFH